MEHQHIVHIKGIEMQSLHSVFISHMIKGSLAELRKANAPIVALSLNFTPSKLVLRKIFNQFQVRPLGNWLQGCG